MITCVQTARYARGCRCNDGRTGVRFCLSACGRNPSRPLRGRSLTRVLSACCVVALLLVVQGCATTGTSLPPQTSTHRVEAQPPSNGKPSAPPPAAASKRGTNGSSMSERGGPIDPDETCLIEDEEAENAPLPPDGKGPALSRALYYCRLAQAYWKRGDLENAIDTLDRAYALVLAVDPGSDADLLQGKEDLRYTISKRILEIYSSRHLAVNGTRNEIPLTLNKHVQDEIDSFTIGRERDFFADAYRRSGRHRARIEAALKGAGLPAELAWLPLIESGYKVTALSPARALGLWQFIPSTGYRYNLNRDKYVDERLDAEKATRGAIEYLKELHGMFGDWTTVLAAYNCGENRVLRTIQAQNINYLDNFWDLYERLPRETARYVPRFLATLHIVQNLPRYGLADVPVDPAQSYETVAIPRQCSLKSVAQTTGIDLDLLQELNAELRQGILPEDGYELRVPNGGAALVGAKLYEIPVYREPPPVITVVRHKVQKGDTIETLARKYGSDEKSILAANTMRRSGPLRVGTTIRVPQTCPPAAAARATVPPKVIEHTVRKGDTLAGLAQRYGTTPEEIQKQNRLPNAVLKSGQVLRIAPPPAAPAAQAQVKPDPLKPKSEPSKPKTGIYAVRSGDTVYSIARRHNMSIDRLLAMNHLDGSSKLQPGQKLIVDN
jgi:membrane-bound lytic murein transglycosylase D